MRFFLKFARLDVLYTTNIPHIDLISHFTGVASTKSTQTDGQPDGHTDL